MEQLWKKNLIHIDPYVPGEQPSKAGIVKLNANENPYPPSPKVGAVLRRFDPASLRYYPDADGKKLKNALAAYHGVKGENVFLGNGSDDVIALCFQAFFRGELPICYPDITYSFYPVWSTLFQVPYVTKALDENYRINVRDYDAPNGGVILPNPNAPTGIGEGKAFFVDLLEHNQDCVVIIDEAYADFGEYSALELLEKYENLLVVRTFSKSRSLAGLRLGYAVGSAALVSTLEAVKNSYNSYTVDSLTLEAAAASVEDDAYFQETVEKVKLTRSHVTNALREMGFTVLESQTNFVLITKEGVDAADLFAYLKTKNVYVRYFKLPRVDNHLRVTIGTETEMEQFLAGVEAYLIENR